MKRMLWFFAVAALWAFPAPAQDAATEERLNKLSGQIEDLIAAQKAQQKQISNLAQEIGELRDRVGQPNENYATQNDVKGLREALREIDRKRMEDAEKIRDEVVQLGKTLMAARKAAAPAVSDSGSSKSSVPDKYFEHTVERGDTLSSIVQAYRDQNIKVTLDAILKANPGLKPERMQIGQKIIIPAP